MKLKIFLFLGQYLIFCDKYEFANAKAVRGENVRQTTPSEFPFIVFITVSPNRYFDPLSPFFCTGSLISVRDVLTSQHCLIHREINDIQINAASHDLRNSVIYYPEWWVGYETWAMHKNIRLLYPGNDLTIIRLTQNVTDVIPAQILTVPKHTLYGSKVLLVSWGISNNGQIPVISEAVETDVLTKEDCEARYLALCGMRTDVNDALVCTAANPYAVVTDGDYGSPIIFDNKIIGVTKGSAPKLDGSFNENKVNVHYSPAFFKRFIIDITENCK